MSTVVHNYDTAGNYTIGSGIEVYNSYARLIGWQDSSDSPAYPSTTGTPDDDASGEFGNALASDGSIKYVRYGTSSGVSTVPSKLQFGATDDFTLECRMKRAVDPSSFESIVSTYTASAVMEILIKNTGGTIYAQIEGSGSTTIEVVESTTDVCDGAWHHIALVRDHSVNDEIRLYVDGTQEGGSIADNTSGNIVPSTNNFDILIRPGASLRYGGSIDEVRVSDNIRYSSNFTAPTEEFVADANTMLLLHCEDNAAPSTSNPTIYKATGDNINVSSWTSFAEDATKYGANAEVKYNLYNGSNYQYWNGSAWANSDGTYAQSSDASTINTNIGSFTTGSITGFNIKTFLHADASDTPIVDSVTATYVASTSGVKDFMKFF